MVIAGALVEVNHPTRGLLQATTDRYGLAVINLERNTTFTVTASTTWGHGAKTVTIDPATKTTLTLKLTRPNNRGTMRLSGGGTNLELLYRSSSNAPWVAMPANYEGKASFVGYGGWYYVAKRCLANGSVVGEKQVSVSSGSNRSTSISGYCP